MKDVLDSASLSLTKKQKHLIYTKLGHVLSDYSQFFSFYEIKRLTMCAVSFMLKRELHCRNILIDDEDFDYKLYCSEIVDAIEFFKGE